MNKEKFVAYAYPLTEITINIQPTSPSEKTVTIARLESVIGMLKTGKISGVVREPAPEVKPVATVYHHKSGVSIGGSLNHLPHGTPLYTHPAPPSELVKAATELAKFIRGGMDLYASDDRAKLKSLVGDLDAALDKVKP